MYWMDRLKTMMSARQQRAAAAFEELAAELARQDKPQLGKMIRILEASGKTPDDLQQAVEREKSKALSLARMAIAEGERAAIAFQQVEAEIARPGLEEAQQRHLLARLDQLRALIDKGKAARQELLRQSPPEVAREMASIGKAIQRVQNRLAILGQALPLAHANLVQTVHQGDNQNSQRPESAWRRIEVLEQRLEDLQAEMDALRQMREQAEAKALALVLT